MIQGYAARDSVVAGGRLQLHVATDQPRFRVEFHRLGGRPRLVDATGWLPGRYLAPPPHPDPGRRCAHPAVDWGWPAYPFVIGAGWEPGIYAADLVDAGRPPARHRECFLVREALPGRRSPILYKVATFTRHAYNLAGASGPDGGSSLYQHPVYLGPGAPGEPRGHKVSMRRPAGDSHYSLWDLPFVAWLERNGYPVEFCSDLDLHEDPALPGAYRLLLSAGHDEYWSEPMRSGVERFVAAGGNAAFFSGNVCWWRVHPVDANTALACDTDHAASAAAHHFPATDQWWAPEPEGAGQPENTLTGVSFRNAGEWAGWFGPGERPHLGFRLQHTDHWVFAGTGLRGAEGGRPDVLGAGSDLVGYECDGATYQAAANGVAMADGRGGTPPSFLILGVAVLAPRREDYYDESPGAWRCPPREPGAASPPAATMGVHTVPGGGTVFTAATTNWPVVVATGADRTVERITRNVLETLTRR